MLELADGRVFERYSGGQFVDGRTSAACGAFATSPRRAGRKTSASSSWRASDPPAREAERASAMKDEFLATLSHELRTPLSAILGWAHILRARRMSEAELHQGLEVIERNARMQTQLIEDLLDMSRITSGKMRLDVQPVEPVSFIEAAIETVRPAAEAKGITLSKLLDPAAGPVTGDPSRLQQVVWNLLSNAIKFTGKADGQVLLRAGELARRDHRRRHRHRDRAGVPAARVRPLPASRRLARRARPGASAWGSRSSSTWSSCTAARCA